MGSAGEEPHNSIDGSVGALVWVRRRNGSWWPGRILGPDELPEGCVPTPRSGTPVKLLGREDASVDWYNLEKSKRVKAFRCGEYDDCIEKAKASASHLSKKAVKYARREDAILHALELENARLVKDIQDNEQHNDKESPPSARSVENINNGSSSSEDGSDSAPELSRSVVSFEEPRKYFDAIKDERKRKRNPFDSEDDGTERVKRMRGLEDLGMGVSSPLRRKRSKVGHVQEFSKKRNRRRTLSKVLECTPMVCVPVGCEQLSSPTGLESNESKINNSVVMNNYNSDCSTGVPCENGISLDVCRNGDDASLRSKAKENEISSERLFDVPLVAEEKQQSAAGVSKTTGPHCSQSSHIETISLTNEEHVETGSTSSGTADVHNNTIIPTVEKNSSEWQLKGKRNSRPRKIKVDDEPETHRSHRVGGPLISDVKSKPIEETRAEEFRGWCWNAPPRRECHVRELRSDVVAPQRLLPYRQSRFSVNPKYDASDFSLSHHTNNGGPAGLYDVNVEVQGSYRPQHVPYISLMSKLNGRPVTGHPLPIEVLDDGLCDDLLGLGPECYSSSSELEYDNISGRLPTNRRSTTKSLKSRRNGPRNGLLSKKIRKLSSLTGSQRQSQHEKKPVLENLKGPSIACVPLKVVFSRINAALMNSSIRHTPRLNTTSGT